MKSAFLLTLILPLLFGLELKGSDSNFDLNKLCECKIQCPVFKCPDGAILYKDPIIPCSCDNCPFCAFEIEKYGCCNYNRGSRIKVNGTRRICKDEGFTCWEGVCLPKWLVPCLAY